MGADPTREQEDTQSAAERGTSGQSPEGLPQAGSSGRLAGGAAASPHGSGAAHSAAASPPSRSPGSTRQPRGSPQRPLLSVPPPVPSPGLPSPRPRPHVCLQGRQSRWMRTDPEDLILAKLRLRRPVPREPCLEAPSVRTSPLGHKSPRAPEPHFPPRAKKDRLLGRSRLPVAATGWRRSCKRSERPSGGPGPAFH